MTTSHGEKDETLLQKTAKGDRLAFRRLMSRYSTPVFNYLYYMLQDYDTAEDISQDVWLKVFQHAANWRPKAQVKTWLFRIARNTAINELKAARRQSVSLDSPWSEGGSTPLVETISGNKSDNPEKHYLDEEMKSRLQAALSRLPESQRSALLLKRYEGLSYKEIASVLDCTVSAVESLIFRARRNLQDALEDTDGKSAE